MPNRTPAITGRRLLAALVLCTAVLGIASMIHPTDSIAVPVISGPSGPMLEPASTGLAIGILVGVGYEAELIAGTPEATCDVKGADGTDLATGLTIEELLLDEYRFLPEGTPPAEVWPEAFMDVEIPTDAW